MGKSRKTKILVDEVAIGEIMLYAAEHLLTFQSQHKLKSASKVSIEVFQKVANLEKQNKLYVQDIIVHVDNGSVKLLDSQSFDVVENFQFSEQQLVTVFDLTERVNFTGFYVWCWTENER